MYKNNVILISIKPCFVKHILDRTKRYEYRRSIPKNKCKIILIYSTFPVKKIVAYVQVEEILKLPIKKLWQITKNHSGISKKFFFQYFFDKKIGYAYKLGKVTKINDLNINKLNLKYPPQNFVYISTSKYNHLFT